MKQTQFSVCGNMYDSTSWLTLAKCLVGEQQRKGLRVFILLYLTKKFGGNR